jgi:hypothetical protein
MPPRSKVALDIVDDGDVGSSSTSGIISIKRSQSQLLSVSTRKQHKKSKSVCFFKYDRVKEISHINDFSQKKMERLWFTLEERSETREECRELVRRCDAGQVMEEHVMFGLEKQTKVRLEPFLKFRRGIIETVLSLQKEAQETISVAQQPNLISNFYEKSCSRPALQARLSALELALEVKTETAVPIPSEK